MNRAAVVLAFAIGASASSYGANPRTKSPAPLAAVHTVFVAGNSEAAAWMRKEFRRQARVFPKHHRAVCLSLADNPKRADAVLDINEVYKAPGIISGPGVTVSGTLTDKGGDLLWSDAKSDDSGFIHSGAGGASLFLMRALEKKVCPKWHHL